MSGLNHYAYCSANPIKYTDPMGLDVFDDEDASLGAAMTAAAAAATQAESDAIEQWENEGRPGTFEEWCYGISPYDTNKDGVVEGDETIQALYDAELDLKIAELTKSNNIDFTFNLDDYLNNKLNDIVNSPNIWRGSQYDLSDIPKEDNKFCFVSSMLRDCLEKMGIEITKSQAKDITQILIDKGLITEKGIFISKSNPIQDAIWEALNNNKGNFSHSLTSNLNTKIDDKTSLFVNAYGIYSKEHWVSVEGKIGNNYIVFDSVKANISIISPDKINSFQ